MIVKAISIVDLLQVDIFQGMTRFDLIKRENDEMVNDVLYKLGVDSKDHPVYIQACQHRTAFDNKVVVDYRFIGMERTDKKWKPFATLHTRINSHKDKSLQQILYGMCEGQMPEDKDGDTCNWQEEDTDPDFRDNVETIKTLQMAQINIRGGLHDHENLLFL